MPVFQRRIYTYIYIYIHDCLLIEQKRINLPVKAMYSVPVNMSQKCINIKIGFKLQIGEPICDLLH